MSEMAFCRECGAEIEKSAKICPVCGEKTKKFSALVAVLIVLGVIAVLGVIIAFSEFDGGMKESDTPAIFTIGDAVELNDVYVTLKSAEMTNGYDILAPDYGNVFVICEFEVYNQSSEELSISSIFNFEAYVDDYATSMSIMAGASSSKEPIGGTVAPGRKIRGIIGYEVPCDWKMFEIQFIPDIQENEYITFAFISG